MACAPAACDNVTRQRGHLLLYDGDCAFCRRCAMEFAARDTEGRFDCLPYQDCPSPPMTPELRDACERSLHVITSGGRTLSAGRACLFAWSELGHERSARLLARPPLLGAVEASYRAVAALRPLLSRAWSA